MDQFPQMLYRAGGSEQAHGGNFSTLVVGDAEAFSAALADGWHETTTAAVQAGSKPAEVVPEVPDDAPPTREELEAKAHELGIKFDGRWGDKKLSDAIAAKLAA